MANYKQFAADTQVKTGAGKIKGLFVSTAADTPLITIYDTPDGDTSNDPKIIDAFTPAAATMYFLGSGDGGIYFNSGLFIDIGGTVKATIIYE